ncbi:MAG: cob(I)yrinic acid a,c-diamide adenosyltransferase [Muribaculaceae bacterium]
MMTGKIYTATGDRGTTSLVGGKRVKKNCVRIEAYGTVDELNSFLGQLAVEMTADYPELTEYIRTVQSKMFNIGGYLATDFTATPGSAPSDPSAPTPCRGLSAADVERIEALIDELTAQIPPLRCFVLPGSGRLSALANVCRAVSRRCERRVLDLADEAPIAPELLIFINRLSDFLFTLARYFDHREGLPEVAWNPNA